ncbi:UNVERIFIED_CONTAM: RNA-dependent RNA polymerase 6 [Sesamum radiatum]|uniref:RNA-dependent RNA polymerase n=1 Tax=Sesamum radiatum TaxID=300843 RepID=A0AAW2KXT5_SESRA
MNERRRTTTPYKLSDVLIETGVMRRADEFLVGWRGPRTGVDFLVDPFNGMCKLHFTKDTAFSFKGEARSAVIKCNFKIEFLPREINEINQYRDFSSLIVLLQLASSPLIYYRTADDDIEESVPFDLLDDDDPWIRTTDFTPTGALVGVILTEFQPDLGMVHLSSRHWNISENLGYQFMTKVQPEELNIVALKHICSYKRPVYDAIKALDSMQKWLLNNPKLLERPREMDDVVEVRRLIITPSKAYCLPPEVELSNRVLRNYKNIADRFLRVTFMDEAMQTLNKNVLMHYASPIRNVAKCAARMGQCFSSTYATIEVPLTEVNSQFPDVERNGYVFSDGMIVTLLSALEVRDDIFWRMQETMVSRLDWMLEDSDTAFDVLTASCTDQGNTAAIMLSAGFRPQTEPHLRGMLTSIRAAQLGDLRERARIFVPLGRWLMGCLDELGKLEHGQCFIQVSNPSIEDCFVKHGSQFSETKKKLQVVTGLVAIAKNPCLHPGDVRILEAVDVPELHHLYDCLVFPQKGDRPHTNEASGSDLDGDLYFVTWDENLIPPSKRSWTPMEYAPGEVKQLPREVKHSDIIEFFTRNMVNESLGAICNAHVVHADLSEYGALDEKCIKLAELAATAVDFPKTGKIVNMPAELKPKTDHEASAEHTFASDDIIYNQDLEVTGSTSFIADAWNCKCSYDGQLIGLLGQYKVNREEEVVTGHIWSMPKYSSKKQGELKERLKHAYSTLRKDFRKVFECMGPEFDQLSDDEKNIMYEKRHQLGTSFAWIAADYLARIKIKRRMMENTISTKPIDSLGRYLADKI